MHSACRGKSERQYDGCDCFGSHTAFLRNAGLPYSSSKNHWNWCRIRRVCWPCLATGWSRSEQLKKRSRSTSTRSLVKRMIRKRRHRDRGSPDGQRGGVTCLRVWTASSTRSGAFLPSLDLSFQRNNPRDWYLNRRVGHDRRLAGIAQRVSAAMRAVLGDCANSWCHCLPKIEGVRVASPDFWPEHKSCGPGEGFDTCGSLFTMESVLIKSASNNLDSSDAHGL